MDVHWLPPSIRPSTGPEHDCRFVLESDLAPRANPLAASAVTGSAASEAVSGAPTPAAYNPLRMSARTPSAPRTSRPFRLHGGFRSSDLDEIRTVVGAAQHPVSVDLFGRAPRLRFQLHHHPLSRVALTHAVLDHEGRLRVEAPPLESHYFLQIPLRGVAEARHGARAVTVAPEKAALLLSPGCETTMQGLDGFEEITLEIDASAVAGTWTDLTGEPTDRHISFEPTLRLDVEPGASIVRLTRFLIDEVSRPASALATSSALARLEEALILCLLQGQPHSSERTLRHRPTTATASVVGDAEAWMEAHAAEPITMTAVARAHGISLRSLQRAFERHRGYAPRGFLRRVRMRRARARLRLGGAPTVTQVAFDLGFRHLGRFSVDYRTRFGESPSATLRRSRRSRKMPEDGVAKRTGTAPDSAFPWPLRSEPETCRFCVGEVITG